MIWLAVLLGGALGSAARHAVNQAVASLVGTATPYATALVNMAGSLAIGVLAGAIASGRLSLSTTARTFVFVGILGGFTTFSSFMLDSLTLLETGATPGAAMNLVVQPALGFVLVYLGFTVAARLG